jgi:hypothetical protein
MEVAIFRFRYNYLFLVAGVFTRHFLHQISHLVSKAATPLAKKPLTTPSFGHPARGGEFAPCLSGIQRRGMKTTRTKFPSAEGWS